MPKVSQGCDVYQTAPRGTLTPASQVDGTNRVGATGRPVGAAERDFDTSASSVRAYERLRDEQRQHIDDRWDSTRRDDGHAFHSANRVPMRWEEGFRFAAVGGRGVPFVR